jgi:hypothetical protein
LSPLAPCSLVCCSLLLSSLTLGSLGLRKKAEGATVISQARVLKQMLQLHFDVLVVERSRWTVKVIRRQWQEPV